MRLRIVIALLIGLFFSIVCYAYQYTPWYQSLFSHPAGDFFWALRSARDVLMARDPYNYPYDISAIPYPLTTALIGMPFTVLSDRVGASLFLGISSALLAFALTKKGYWKLLLFLSPAYWQSLLSIQFVPLLMAVPFLPWLLPLVLIKPQVGLPIALQTSWRKSTIAVTLLLLFLTLLFYPTWPFRWVSQIGTYAGFIPLFTVAGPILLLALIRWKTRRAKIFLMLSVLPQQIFFYDQLLLWLLPETFREMLILTLVSWPAFFLAVKYDFHNGPILSVIFMYFPMLIMILKIPWSNFYGRAVQPGNVTTNSP